MTPPAEQERIKREILARLAKVQPHIPAARVRALPAFDALYSQLPDGSPHRLEIDKKLEARP